MQESLSSFIGAWLPQIEDEIKTVLRFPATENVESGVEQHYGMMHYHMGWANANLQPQKMPAGKRLRPIFCLLACEAIGGSAADALPAAAAIEILHNFSLVHDDIEDGDETRHHRTTMWKLWGVPLAINTGDAMFSLAYMALSRLQRRGVAPNQVLKALNTFSTTCVELTEGQHMDMSFEQRNDVQPAEYFRMIEGKTASLVGCSTAIGALVANGTDAQVKAMQHFGQSVDLAFQIQDDILGIWGEPEVTGKPAGNDLLRQKKSFPLLHALNDEHIGLKLKTLMAGGVSENQLPRIIELLAEAKSREVSEEQQILHHTAAMNALEEGMGNPAAESMLAALADSLMNRSA